MRASELSRRDILLLFSRGESPSVTLALKNRGLFFFRAPERRLQAYLRLRISAPELWKRTVFFVARVAPTSFGTYSRAYEAVIRYPSCISRSHSGCIACPLRHASFSLAPSAWRSALPLRPQRLMTWAYPILALSCRSLHQQDFICLSDSTEMGECFWAWILVSLAP